jgi:hypothetical protein
MSSLPNTLARWYRTSHAPRYVPRERGVQRRRNLSSIRAGTACTSTSCRHHAGRRRWPAAQRASENYPELGFANWALVELI